MEEKLNYKKVSKSMFHHESLYSSLLRIRLATVSLFTLRDTTYQNGQTFQCFTAICYFSHSVEVLCCFFCVLLDFVDGIFSASFMSLSISIGSVILFPPRNIILYFDITLVDV